MFWEKFVLLCNKKGMSPNAVCAELGLSTAVATKWKNGAVPRDATLMKIADYFGVSVEYLKGEETTQPAEISGLDVLPNGRTYYAPLYETVSAGFGALARDEIVEYVPVHVERPTDARRTLCIRVKGDSMSPVIDDGDIIQVLKQDTVDSRSLAVVLLDGGEGYVKRIEYGKDWIELQSLNPMYKPMRITGADVESVRIVGAVVRVIKDTTSPIPFYDTTWGYTNNVSSELMEETADMDGENMRALVDYARYLKSRRKS